MEAPRATEPYGLPPPRLLPPPRSPAAVSPTPRSSRHRIRMPHHPGAAAAARRASHPPPTGERGRWHSVNRRDDRQWQRVWFARARSRRDARYHATGGPARSRRIPVLPEPTETHTETGDRQRTRHHPAWSRPLVPTVYRTTTRRRDRAASTRPRS